MRLHKYYKMVRVDYEDEGLFEISNVTSTPGTITVNNQGIRSDATLQYSTDGVDWTTAVFTSNVCEITLPANGNCYFKGTNFYKNGQFPNAMFNCDVNHNVKGNLYSIVDPVNYASATTSYDWMFRALFSGDTHIVDAGGLVLPVGVTSLNREMLGYAFNGCTSLTTAPDLSNITSIGEYGLNQAFQNCTSLTTAPDLSNITSIGDSGLFYAFYGCTSLTTAPDLSNVTSLESYALSNAFNGCTSLTAAPDLSNVTSLESSALSSAFYGCTSLTAAPDLSNVTSLGSDALYSAFSGCTKLETIYAPNVDTWETSKFNSWVLNAGSSAATPKQMIFQTQALLDACPSGNSGFGSYSKILAS